MYVHIYVVKWLISLILLECHWLYSYSYTNSGAAKILVAFTCWIELSKSNQASLSMFNLVTILEDRVSGLTRSQSSKTDLLV